MQTVRKPSKLFQTNSKQLTQISPSNIKKFSPFSSTAFVNINWNRKCFAGTEVNRKSNRNCPEEGKICEYNENLWGKFKRFSHQTFIWFVEIIWASPEHWGWQAYLPDNTRTWGFCFDKQCFLNPMSAVWNAEAFFSRKTGFSPNFSSLSQSQFLGISWKFDKWIWNSSLH